MKKLDNILVCQKKAFYQEKVSEDLLGLKPVLFKKCLREALADGMFYELGKKNVLVKYFKEYFDACCMDKEREELLHLMEIKFFRFINFVRMNGFNIIGTCVTVDLVYDELNDCHNKATFDIVFEHNGIIYPTIVHEGKIAYSGQDSAKTNMRKDIKNYIYWIAAKEKFKDKPIRLAQVGLQRKDERIVTEEKMFEKKKNWLDASFESEDEARFQDELIDAMNLRWKESKLKEAKDKKSCDDCSYRGLCKFKDKEIKYEYLSEKAKAPAEMKFTMSQQEFINAHEGYIRVIATAGSGKTTCIINRCVDMIKNHVCNISDILMITFTEKGAKEMKEKLAYWLNRNGIESKPSDFNVFTFNSFGNKIIQENYELLGYSKKPSLISSLDAYDIVKDLLDKCNKKVSFLNYRNPMLNMFKAKGAILEAYECFQEIKKGDSSCVQKDEEIRKLYDDYTREMVARNLIDYDDQLMKALKLLKEREDVCRKYNYQHILVDEAQDTSDEQFELLDKLVEVNGMKSYVVCGDDAQAIYGFRGVSMKSLLEFNDKHPGTKDYMLMDNFRSTRQIIELADNIISLNKHNMKKSMIGHADGPNPYTFLEMRTNQKKEDEIKSSAAAVAQDIRTKIEIFGLEPNEVAVIARTKKELEAVSKELSEIDIPNIVAYPELFIESHEIKAIKGLLGIMTDSDKLDLLDIATYLQVFEPDKYNSSLNITDTCYMEAGLIKEDMSELNKEEKVRYFDDIVRRKNIPAVHGLYNVFKERGMNTLGERYQYLHRLFLYHGDDAYNPVDEKVNAVTLTTAHSSKGREWEYVAIMLDGMMPGETKYCNGKFQRINQVYCAKDSKRIGEIEEDRRLLFVAVTRAKRYLFLAGHLDRFQENEKDA